MRIRMPEAVLTDGHSYELLPDPAESLDKLILSGIVEGTAESRELVSPGSRARIKSGITVLILITRISRMNAINF